MSSEEKRRRDRAVNLRWLYGLTPEQYDEMLEAQGGVCAICGGISGGKRKRLFVDHSHDTGAVRALICIRCNYLVAQVESKLAAKAQAYVRVHAEIFALLQEAAH
jgi:hypothetical protein